MLIARDAMKFSGGSSMRDTVILTLFEGATWDHQADALFELFEAIVRWNEQAGRANRFELGDGLIRLGGWRN